MRPDADLTTRTERCPTCGVVSAYAAAERERPWCPPPWRPEAPAGYAVLVDLLARVRFRPGWTFHLMTYGHETLLAVELRCVDTYHPERGATALVGHRIPVPSLDHYGRADRATWRRWLLDTCVMVDTHEACEWFAEEMEDGTMVRPFDPHHDPMQHAYRVVDWTVDT